MSGLVESATAVMTMAERRLDVVSRNVANMSTPGYKRHISYSRVLATGMSAGVPEVVTRDDAAQGNLQSTSNPLDLAISGPGYFKVRDGDAMLYSRQGQFRRDADGSLVSPQGYVLQATDGGDLSLDADAQIAADGSVTAGGRPLGRIAIERPAEGAALQPVGETFFAAPASAGMDAADESTTVRSGMLESSNVTLGDEMTESMLALRQAESGARLIQVYDDLVGRAVTTFAGGSR